jgi:4-amino-4-deoxy-L-arabinose transferase-like glycosyltransferase
VSARATLRVALVALLLLLLQSTVILSIRVGGIHPDIVWLLPITAALFALLGAIFGQQQMVQIDFFSLFLVVAVSSALLVLPVNRLMRWALSTDGNRRTLVSANSTESGLW